MMKQLFGVGKDICSGENKFFKLVKVRLSFGFTQDINIDLLCLTFSSTLTSAQIRFSHKILRVYYSFVFIYVENYLLYSLFCLMKM